MSIEYSNPNYALLSTSQARWEFEQLQPMRARHDQELFASGVIHRILASKARSNARTLPLPITEGTSFYPFRKPVWNMGRSSFEDMCADLQLSPATSVVAQPVLRDSFLLCLGRRDAVGYGFSLGAYALGVKVPEAAADRLWHDAEPYRSFDAMHTDDLRLVDHQLAELGQFALAHRLTVLDQLTLTVGHGEVLNAG